MNYSRRQFAISAASGVSLYLTASRGAAQQDAAFSSDVQVVNLLATVRDKKSSAIVRDLEKNDFSLVEDGRPQTIRYFARETDLPLTIGLMVDTSMSQVKVLDAERGASFRFLDQVLRENKDHVFIMQFDLTVQTRQALTGSRRDLDQALTMVDTPTRNQLRSQYGGGTLLFDAIVDASQDVMSKLKGRKALMVLSDGGDNGSDATLATSIEAAQRAETLIYAILYTEGGFGSGEGRSIMQRLAKDSGGGFFEVSKKLTIDQVFAAIEEDLRSQYSIGYVSDKPAQIAEFRRIQLTVKRSGLVVQTRDRYWAGPAGQPE
jgi:VWFA-related protein